MIDTPNTRHSLILRLRNRADVLVWREFVEIYGPLIRALAVRQGLQDSDADDVSQEVLTRVAKHIEKWDGNATNASFRGWLATITRNRTIQFFRETSRRPITGADSEIVRVPTEIDADAFDLEHNRQLFLQAARRVQSKFEARTWKAFWLTAVEGVSIADAARQIGTPVGQIYVARSRVMKALRDWVEQSSFGSSADWR